MALLKAGSKAAQAGRKRRRHEVFDEGMPVDSFIAEEIKEDKPETSNEEPFADVTHMLKKSKRNRTPHKID